MVIEEYTYLPYFIDKPYALGYLLLTIKIHLFLRKQIKKSTSVSGMDYEKNLFKIIDQYNDQLLPDESALFYENAQLISVDLIYLF